MSAVCSYVNTWDGLARDLGWVDNARVDHVAELAVPLNDSDLALRRRACYVSIIAQRFVDLRSLVGRLEFGQSRSRAKFRKEDITRHGQRRRR